MPHDDHCHDHHHHHTSHTHSGSTMPSGLVGCVTCLLLITLVVFVVKLAIGLALMLIPLALVPVWMKLPDWSKKVKWALTAVVLALWLALMPVATQLVTSAFHPQKNAPAATEVTVQTEAPVA